MRIGVLTTGRQDWGILRSTCAWLRDDARFDLRILVGGMACAERFGRVDRLITNEGFALSESLDWWTPGISAHEEAGKALAMIGDALARQRLAALVLVGDRYETLAAATAATLAKVPIVHLHGGEETEGAFDNSFRHAITKMAHLHLASHRQYADAIIGMGEDPSCVHVVGAPGLDNLRRQDLASPEELAEHLGSKLERPVVVVTVHPATLADDVMHDARAVVEAMDVVDATYVITLPNSDPGNEGIRTALLDAAKHPRRVAVDALGERRYWGLLKTADAILGNSSSGLIEAPALGVPTINVGDRQRGRLREPSVVDVPAEGAAVARALSRALVDTSLRKDVSRMPLDDVSSAERIGRVLSAWTPPSPPAKRLHRRGQP